MEHNRSSRRSTRGVASSSNPQFAQIMPESGHLPSIPTNPSNSYPFDARVRMTTSMRERESRMKDLKVLTPIYPHIQSLMELNILDEVREHFVDNGFGFVFMDNPLCVYEDLVREFIYSFELQWVEHEAPHCENYVGEWKFRLNGQRYRYSRRDLLCLFNVPDEDSFPTVERETRNNFWRMISETNVDYVSQLASSKLKDPIWRFVHRFIATCVHLRRDEWRWVSKTDLDLMCCFYEQQSIDAISYLTDALEECTFPSFRGTYIGGGHLVTLLAEDLGLTLDPEHSYPLRFLKEEEMIRRKFIKVIRYDNGEVRTYLIGRDPIPDEFHSPPPTDRPGPSSSAPHEPHETITMESLASELRALAAYTSKGFRWHGDMFAGLFSRMGYDGYRDPPQHQSFQAPTHESPAGDGAEDEDDMEEDAEESETF